MFMQVSSCEQYCNGINAFCFCFLSDKYSWDDAVSELPPRNCYYVPNGKLHYLSWQLFNHGNKRRWLCFSKCTCAEAIEKAPPCFLYHVYTCRLAASFKRTCTTDTVYIAHARCIIYRQASNDLKCVVRRVLFSFKVVCTHTGTAG